MTIVRHRNGCIVDTSRKEGWTAAEQSTAPTLLARIAHADPVMTEALTLEAERIYWVRRLAVLLSLPSAPDMGENRWPDDPDVHGARHALAAALARYDRATEGET